MQVEELGWFLLVKRYVGADLPAVYKYRKGGYKDGGVKSFLAVRGDTLRSNNHNVTPGRFRWHVRENPVLGRMAQPWHRSPRGGGISGRGGR